MSDETSAPAGGEAIAASAPADTSELSISQAREMLFSQLDEKPTAESAEPATADPELSKDNSAPETDPAEATEEAEPAEVPPIEPPRSWTKAEKERFQSLPRETQEYLHSREQERERDFRRSQNEIAEQRKAITAEREAAEKARQNYEAKLTTTTKTMEDALQNEFGDIQTLHDVRNLQANDPFRFQAWQVRQMELTAAQSERAAAEQRQTQERHSKRSAYEAEQNALLVELVPEMASPKKASELRERAVTMLVDDLGLKNDQLTRWMQDDTGHEILSNAGIQKLIADGLKYRDILAAPKAVAAKPAPPVQRPGVSRPAGAADSTLQVLDANLTRSGSLKDAKALLDAQLRASQRRAS